MAVKFLDNTGLGYFWSKIKAWCNATFAAIAHTHTSYAIKHSYTTAANAAKNWYRIANANTSQTDTAKPIHAQFILRSYNTSYDAGYRECWLINAVVYGRLAHITVFGNQSAPFSQARLLYESTVADLDTNDRPAIDIYLNYQLANGTTKIEIEEIYNGGGWTFVPDGQIAASTVPSGFENLASAPRNNGVNSSTYADYVSYLNRQISNFTAAFTLADSYLYRSRTLNCTGTFTITVPSINSGYMWCVIKNKNTSSGVITLHPSTTSVLIDGSNADIMLQPMEYVCIHSAGANNYSLIADGRWKSQKADKATTLAGYGITDAKIANGTITLGSNSITPLTSVPSHNQASNTINVMTGYSKPNSTSAIAISDTLNQAIGKLEKAIDDADITNVIHATGDETINGIKEFSNLYYDSTQEGEENYESSSLIIRHATYEKGTTPITNHYHANLVFLSKTGNNINWGGRLGLVENRIMPDNQNCMVLSSVKNEIVNGVDTRDSANLTVGYDDNGEKFCTCPSTSTTRTQDYDVITRDFIPKDTRIVHTIGNEDIHGNKTFFDRNLCVKSNTIEKGVTPSDNLSITIPFLDKNNSWVGMVDFIQRTSGAYDLKLGCYNQSTNALNCIYCGTDANGIDYAQAASTSSSRSANTDIVTRDWIPKDTRIVHTSGNETVGGTKTFSNDIVLNASSPDILFYNSTMTKGTNPSETMWNEVLFCDKTGNRDAAYRLGQIAVYVDTTGQTNIGLYAYNWVSGSTSKSSIGVSYPKNGTAYTWAPTPNTSDNSTKIATTAFVKAQGYLTSHQSLASCVKTSGDQEISGYKTFTNSITIKRDNPYLDFIETDWQAGTPQSSGTSYQGIHFYDKNEKLGASIFYHFDQSKNSYMSLHAYKMTSASASSNDECDLYIAYNADGNIHFRGGSNGKVLLGRSANKWKEIWCTQSSINSSSDKRLKQSIENIPEIVLDAWDNIDWVQYKFNDAVKEKGLENARLHTGLIAQDIEDIFKKRDLNINNYGLFLYDEWDEEKEERDEQGNLVKSCTPAGDAYGLRYTEVLCMEAAYQRRKNKILENRISELEKQVSDMLQILQNLTSSNG